MDKYSEVIAILEEKYEDLKAIADEDVDKRHPEWDDEARFGYRAWIAGQRKLIEELLEKVREI